MAVKFVQTEVSGYSDELSFDGLSKLSYQHYYHVLSLLFNCHAASDFDIT